MSFIMIIYYFILIFTGICCLVFYRKVAKLLNNYENLVEFLDTHFDDFDRKFWEI